LKTLYSFTKRRLGGLEASGISGIRDQTALEAALGAPKASFGGACLMNLFEMAATYVESVYANHPFLDGNNRAGTACALKFLYLNGYEVDENHDEDLPCKLHKMVYIISSQKWLVLIRP